MVSLFSSLILTAILYIMANNTRIKEIDISSESKSKLDSLPVIIPTLLQQKLDINRAKALK